MGNNIGSQALHLLPILFDVSAQRIEQDHLGPDILHLAQATDHVLRVPEMGTSSMPGIPP